MDTFEIVFSGQVDPGADPQQVRQGVQRLFNAGEDLLQQFFSGRRVVVKRGLDQAAAEKYRQAFASVGALVEVIAEQPAAPVAVEGAALPALQVAPRDEYMAAFAHVEALDFGLAAAGEDLLREKPVIETPQIDVSAISLAPAGSDLGQLPGAEPITAPDISHLSIENIE